MPSPRKFPDVLRRRLIFYAAASLLLIAVCSMLLMGISLFTSWKEIQEDRLLHAAGLKAQTAAEWMRQNRHLARQIAARTGMRQELEALNNGQKSAAEVVPFITRAIHDSLKHSSDVVGITRLNDKGQPVAHGGTPIPANALALAGRDKTRVRFTAPLLLDGQQCILLSAPILNPASTYLGSDIIAVSTASLHQLLQDSTSLGLWPEAAQEPQWFCSLDNVKKLAAFDPALWAQALRLGTAGGRGVMAREGLVLAYTPVADTPWALLLAEDPSALYAPAWKNLCTVLGGIALLYVLCLGGIVIVSRPLAGKILLHTHELEATIAAKTRQLQQHQAELEQRVERRTRSLAEANAALRDEERRRKELSHELINLLEQVRSDISRDLHDHTGQLLTTLRLSLETIRGEVQTAAPVQAEQLRAAGESVMNIQRSLKSIARGLRPPCLDYLGLEASLDTLLEEYRHAGLSIFFFHKEIPHDLDAELALAFYRIAQEALTNVLRHAHADKAYVNLTRQGDAIILSIEDDGQGFDAEALRTRGPVENLGLTLMRERMTLLHGEFSLESAPEHGTHIIARAPLHKEAA